MRKKSITNAKGRAKSIGLIVSELADYDYISKANTEKIPVGRCHRHLKWRQAGSMRVGAKAAVYMASVLEYLVGELLEISGTSNPLTIAAILPC